MIGRGVQCTLDLGGQKAPQVYVSCHFKSLAIPFRVGRKFWWETCIRWNALWPMNLASRRSVEFNLEYRQLTCGNRWLNQIHKGFVGRTDANKIGSDVVRQLIIKEVEWEMISLPLHFQEITVAPYRSTSTDLPVGRLAVTRDLSCEIDTFGVGVGIVGETGMAEGFLGQSCPCCGC